MITKSKYLHFFLFFPSPVFLVFILVFALKTPITYADPNPRRGHAVIELGGFLGYQGESQHVNIQDLIGDQFTVNKKHDSNLMIGLGYLLDTHVDTQVDTQVNVQNESRWRMSYGVKAFYFAKNTVEGNVIQENLFNNLSYSYHLIHLPVYAIAKATIKTHSLKYSPIVEFGVGPNFMRASRFAEQSLDGLTLPEDIYASHTTTTLSATIGVGMKVNQVFGGIPVECGLRFFYLGKGYLNPKNDIVQNKLSTGKSYAHAVLCSVAL